MCNSCKSGQKDSGRNNSIIGFIVFVSFLILCLHIVTYKTNDNIEPEIVYNLSQY